MSPEGRLAELYEEIRQLGLRCLVMGGHAARFHGVERMTVDYDLHLAVDEAQWRELAAILARGPLLGASGFREGPSWRPDDFRRFVIGQLPDGREERLELWRRNHLLAPFGELWERRTEGDYGNGRVAFLGIEDLIRSKETEREDDWTDVAALEEIADERRLLSHAPNVLSDLRSRRGFERALAAGLLEDSEFVARAASAATHPIPCAYLAPYTDSAFGLRNLSPAIAEILGGPLRKVSPRSARHLALVEAVRRLYRRDAMAKD
ncbi:MAG: hypothetical protein ACREQY_02240, partial [Candidatus Binatia bacterium]